MKHLIAAIVATLISANAMAGILIEPYLGYESGAMPATANADNFDGLDASGKTSGSVAGMRLGFTFAFMLWLALDASNENGNFKYSGLSTIGEDSKFDRSTSWLTVGFDFPILFRAWAGVGSVSRMNFKSDSDITLNGGSTKVGLGFTGLPFLSVNLEYIMNTYDKINTKDTKDGKVKDVFSDLKDNHVVLSVSLPLDIL